MSYPDQYKSSSFIGRDLTGTIKGVAIILMFFHHFFTMPPMWTSSVSSTYSDLHLEFFENPTKICVPVFAFLTGLFYYYSSKKTYRYSLKKITDLWINYVIIMIVLMALATVLGVFDYSILGIIEETFALRRDIMVFCWYVLFYFGAMLMLPLFARLRIKGECILLVLAIIVPRIIVIIFKRFDQPVFLSISEIMEFYYYLPCVFSGYIIARVDGLNWLHVKMKHIKEKYIILYLFICIAFIILPFLIRRYLIVADFMLTPIFVFGLVSVFKLIKKRALLIPLNILGKYSLLMWFIHCMFFNVCKGYTQPVLYYPQILILVLIWGLLICLALAVIIKKPIDLLVFWKNKVLRL